MSTAADILIVERSTLLSWAALRLPVNVPVISKVFTPVSEVTPFVTISFGSVSAGAAGVELQAARTSERIATMAIGRSARRRVKEIPLAMNGMTDLRVPAVCGACQTAKRPEPVRGANPQLSRRPLSATRYQ